MGQVFFPAKYIGNSGTSEFIKLAVERLIEMLKFTNAQINSDGLFMSNEPNIVDAHAYAILRNLGRLEALIPSIATYDFSKVRQFLAIMGQDPAVKNALALEASQPELAMNSQFVGYFIFN